MYPKRSDYPKSFNLGGKKVRISFRKKLPKDTRGLFIAHDERPMIALDPKYSDQVMFETFIHEALHAIEDLMNLKINHTLIHKLEIPLGVVMTECFNMTKREK